MPPSPPPLPPFPTAPVTPSYTCNCAPEVNATTGVCDDASLVVLNYKLDAQDDGEVPYQQCIAPLAYDNVSSAYTFDFCWRAACLPDQFQGVAFSAYAQDLVIPGAGALAAGAVSVVLMKPTCAILSATGSPASDPSSVIEFCQNCITNLPDGGVNDISVYAYAPVGCDDQYVSALLMQLEEGSGPVALESHCPCWEVPAAGGACSGIKVPITLTTTDEDEAGTSFRQCIDPANFDAQTGQMAFSYCWRYACLPDAFTHSNFNATVTKLQRYNINQMPGGLWNTTFHRTDGVSIYVTADPKPLSSFANATTPVPFTFNDSGIVTFPDNGIFDMTFVFQIPVGFDDLSASVQMFGPPPPPSPPVQYSCACNDRPFAGPDGQPTCLDYQTLVYVERADGGSNDTQCITVSNYDVHIKSYAFSECWRYSCQPDDFYGYPYTLTVLGMTKYNIADIPAGDVTLIFQRPYLETFNMSLTAHFADGTSGTYTSANVSSSATTEVMTVPTGGITSVDIVYFVPADMRVDDNSAAIVFNPVPSPPAPPAPPVAPPSPPEPPAPPPMPPLPPGTKSYQAGVTVTAFFYSTTGITSQASLQTLMSSYAASLKANVTMYTVTLPVTFPDFGVVSDCSPNATAAFLVRLGKSLGLSPSVMSTGCKYGGARRRLSAAADSITLTPTINTTDPTTVGPAAANALNNGGGSAGAPDYGTYFTLSRVLLSVSDAQSVQASQCSAIVTATQAAISGVTQSATCVATPNMILASAASTTTPPAAASTPPSPGTVSAATPGAGAPPPKAGDGSSFPLTAVVAGVVGGVVGLALLVGGGVYVKKRRQGSAAASAEQGLTTRFKSYTNERGAKKAASAEMAAASTRAATRARATSGSGEIQTFDDAVRPPSRDAWSTQHQTPASPPPTVRSPSAMPVDPAPSHDDVVHLGGAEHDRPSQFEEARDSPTGSMRSLRSPAAFDTDPSQRPSVTAWGEVRPSSVGDDGVRRSSTSDTRPVSGGDRRSTRASEGGQRPLSGGNYGPLSPSNAANRSSAQRMSDAGMRISNPNAIMPVVLPLGAPENRGQSTSGTPTGDDFRLPVPPPAAMASPSAPPSAQSYFNRGVAGTNTVRPPTPPAAEPATHVDGVLRL